MRLGRRRNEIRLTFPSKHVIFSSIGRNRPFFLLRILFFQPYSHSSHSNALHATSRLVRPAKTHTNHSISLIACAKLTSDDTLIYNHLSCGPFKSTNASVKSLRPKRSDPATRSRGTDFRRICSIALYEVCVEFSPQVLHKQFFLIQSLFSY